MITIKKPSTWVVYQYLACTFCMILVLSNILSAKLVKLPYLENIIIPVGLITYPFTFFISDLVTEIFGAQKAKMMVYMAFCMNLIALLMIQFSLSLPNISADDDKIFKSVLGLSGMRILASLAAYLAAQLVDIQLYAWIKKLTGQKHLWLRNNGSTCASQLLDTIIVDMIYLFGLLGMGMSDVVSIILVSYAYKAIFSFVVTPLFYLAVNAVKSHIVLPNNLTKLQEV